MMLLPRSLMVLLSRHNLLPDHVSVLDVECLDCLPRQRLYMAVSADARQAHGAVRKAGIDFMLTHEGHRLIFHAKPRSES